MIYLKKTTEEQVVLIPNPMGRREAWEVMLHLKSTINSDIISIKGIVDNSSYPYYPLMIRLSEGIMSGEHEYTLSDEVGVLSTGLLIIGEKEMLTEYNKEITYEQYAE